MLRAYRLTYDFSNFGPPQLWEWQQPYIDHLVLNGRTFNRRVVGWWFEDWDALDEDNTRIWQTYYEPKPTHDHISSRQVSMAEHRQVAAVVS
jgi:hypothetical protein